MIHRPSHRSFWPGLLLLMAAGLLPLHALAEKQPRVKRVSTTRASAPLIEGSGPAYAGNAEAMALADEIAERHDLDRKWVRRAIAQARHVPQVVRLVTPPPERTPKNWEQYRSRFLEAERIQAGLAFWRAHRATLERASAAYGVPPEIIIGILGVETYFGRHLGNYRVIDALATLSFDFPDAHPRAAARTTFFRAELGHLLNLKHRAGINPLTLRGSYAGALGLPQFMPSSWANYAVDFDGDGRIDLFGSTADAIGSVANYFKAFNWQPGMPTHYRVDFDYERLDLNALLAPDIRPTFSVENFAAHGVVLPGEAMQHVGPLALVELQNGDYSSSYVAGTANFYTITRYNWSSYYALAVIELGRAVAAARSTTDIKTSIRWSEKGCDAIARRPGASAARCP